jgi:hypothetical protein
MDRDAVPELWLIRLVVLENIIITVGGIKTSG